MVDVCKPQFAVAHAFADNRINRQDMVDILRALFLDGGKVGHGEHQTLIDELKRPSLVFTDGDHLKDKSDYAKRLKIATQFGAGIRWKTYREICLSHGLKPLVADPQHLTSKDISSSCANVRAEDVKMLPSGQIRITYFINGHRYDLVLGKTFKNSYYSDGGLPRVRLSDGRRWYEIVIGLFKKVQDPRQRELLILAMDRLEHFFARRIYEEDILSPSGLSRKVQYDFLRWLDNNYLRPLYRKRPKKVVRITGLRIGIRGDVDPDMIRIFKKVTAKLHPKERKVIGKLRVTVIGEIDRLEERFMEERGVKAFARQSGGWADRRMIIMLGKHKVTEAFFEHELGHVLSSVYGGIARNELFGIHWHFRNHILAHWDKDRSHNHYSKSSTEEWFTEARRLMRSKKPLMPRNILENYSTNDEFCAKDPVGYLVFKRYFHLLKKGAKHPEYAFSMSSFHQARVYVEIFTGQRRAFVSNGRINSDFVAGWNRLKIDMRAESLVRRGNMLYKKAEKRVKNGQRNVAKLLSRAKSYYVKALRMIPEFSLARMQLADVYSLRSEIESEKIPAKMLRRQAIEQLKVAIKSDPLNHNAGLKLAELYRSEGLLQEALRVYDSFMPKFSLLHINLDRVSDIVTERAELLYGLGQYREVVDSLVRLADRHGLSEDSAWLLSLAANNIGAKRAYEIARKKLKELMEDDF